ncbi:replication stress response regulator SDE2-like isoform X2 [Xyrauchen texanus]|uniref:replication stress response regulator SDE2-like isoform X2 n=1 Tax=Xyrauchen texanus TaxID=154827 RepID=UPI002241A5A2|nr:replication stress response regulator SDE2-like isoform X2 [Xyrauchen texanus]
MELFVISPHLRFTNVTIAAGSTVSNLIDHFTSKEGVTFTDFYVKSNGRICHSNDLLQTGVLYRVEPRLCGGKGGFGSMLRALGAQIEKTTNREACRDLSGRRLRDVNHEKEMAEWLKNQADREAEKEQRRLERIQRKLAEPKHYFTDTNYEQQCHDLSERLEDSVMKGMQASSSGLVQADEGPSRKRPTPTDKQKKAKRKCFWSGVGGLDEMGSSGEGSDDSDSETSPSSPGASCSSDVPKPALLPSTCRRQHRTEPQDHPSSTSSSSCLAPCSPTNILGTEGLEREAEIEYTQIGSTEDEKEPMPNTEELEMEEKKEYTPIGSTEDEKVLKPNTEAQNCPADSSQTPELVEGPLDLLSVSGVEQLESLGLERLKKELMERGMKCGGTLQERAARLFSVKGLIPDQIDPVLLAKPSKGKKK